MFNYSPKTSGHASPRGTKLNKRVAYTGGAVNTNTPSTGGVDSGTLLNAANGPPISPVQLLPPIQVLPPTTNIAPSAPVPLLIPMMGPNSPSIPKAESDNNSSALDVHGTDTTVLQNSNISSEDELFEKVQQRIDNEFERCLPRLQGRAAEDVKRKLQILKENWKDKKLSKDVRGRIWDILQALENKDYDTAWERHLSLMVDFTAEVGQWLVAVKRIIHENREMKKEMESSIEQKTDKDSTAANLIDVSDPKISSSSVLTQDECSATDGDTTGSSVDG
ncbi:steroid receptor RNA activator 1-like [Pecten maximus]|uniref:steroid receptor RNA activator 1-like n=1 Tax=Pecten maximus TaxID=6579 RepID=UPI0014586CD9|nr:steroid receptor RNA activator 1-like [Pecten maximus]